MTTGEGLLTAGTRPRVVPLGGQPVLDLSELTFMDSTAIRLILQTDEHARRHCASLVVVRPPAQVLRVLELVGLGDQLDIVDSGD